LGRGVWRRPWGRWVGAAAVIDYGDALEDLFEMFAFGGSLGPFDFVSSGCANTVELILGDLYL
jgi:hypothetical protein